MSKGGSSKLTGTRSQVITFRGYRLLLFVAMDGQRALSGG
jgi:hypothetical protein